MKISPTSDILIKGAHSPAGVAVEVDELTGRSLVAQGLARRAGGDTAPNATTVPAPPRVPVETATATKAPETATAPAARRAGK